MTIDHKHVRNAITKFTQFNTMPIPTPLAYFLCKVKVLKTKRSCKSLKLCGIYGCAIQK